MIDWRDFSAHVSTYFAVGEVLNQDLRRVPRDLRVISNIIALATELDLIRHEWGSPIIVTSWYRPPAINRAVGGVSNSQHLTGRAADIKPANGHQKEFECWLDSHWYGALGYGQHSVRGFTHLDIRNGKGWKNSGSKGVRWNY